MLFDVRNQELVPAVRVTLDESVCGLLEEVLARNAETVADATVLPIHRAPTGEFGLGGGTICLSRDAELVLVRVVPDLDELALAAIVATIARLVRTPLPELVPTFDEGDREGIAATWEGLGDGALPRRWCGVPRLLVAAGSFADGAVEMLQLLDRGSVAVDAFRVVLWSRGEDCSVDVERVPLSDPDPAHPLAGDQQRLVGAGGAANGHLDPGPEARVEGRDPGPASGDAAMPDGDHARGEATPGAVEPARPPADTPQVATGRPIGGLLAPPPPPPADRDPSRWAGGHSLSDHTETDGD